MFKILFSLLILMAMPAWANKVYILHWGTPGGQTERANNAVAVALDRQGMTAVHERLNGCRGIEIWLRNNPTLPAIFESNLFFEANRFIDSKSPQACDHGLAPDKILAIAMSTNFYFCSRDSSTNLQARISALRQGTPIVAYVSGFGDARVRISDDIIRSVNPRARVVKVKGLADLNQGLLSGDFNYVLATGAGIEKSGATCFIQTGHASSGPNMMSLASVVPGNKWHDASVLSIFMGHNVDQNRFRKTVIDAIANDPHYQQQFKFGNSKVGVAAGQSPEQQWQLIQHYLQRLK